MTDDEKKALNRAVEIINAAQKAAEPKWAERQFYLNMYHSYDSVLSRKQWWQTKFAHPFPFFTVEMKSSFYYEGVFGQNSQGLWEVYPWSEDSIRSAQNTTKLLRSQEQGSNLTKGFYQGSKGLNIFGDWFLELYWDNQERYVQQPDQIKLALDGTMQRPIYRREPGPKIRVTEKNQPDARTLHVNSVWPDPKAMSLDTARFVCIRREIPFQELKRQEQEFGRYINVDELKDNGNNIPKISTLYYDTEPYSPFVKSGNASRTGGKNPIDDENQIVEIIDIIYPDTGEIETIANRKVYLGRIIPYANLNNPLVHIKNFGELGKFYGTSDFRAVAAQWRLINQYESMMADDTLMHMRGYTKIARDAGENVKEAYENLRPGSIITMNNLGGSVHERPDLFSGQVFNAKESLINQAQQPMGMNEILQGATPSSNVRSASQFNQLANFGAKILSQGIRTISEGLQEVGKKWVSLNYEFLDVDQSIPIFGQSGIEMIRISPGDIPITANIAVRLSADLEAQKEQKLQQMLQAINMSQQIPGFNTAGAIREWFRRQGAFDDPDKLFLLSDEESAQMVLSQFQQQGPGNVPQEPGLAGATSVASPGQVAQGNVNANQATVPGV